MKRGSYDPTDRDETETTSGNPGAIIGLFADEPEPMDQVSEAAMVARERDPLRGRDAHGES